VTIPDEVLARYAGEYREGTVVLRDGRLHYGGGANPESPMVPMRADLFELARYRAFECGLSTTEDNQRRSWWRSTEMEAWTDGPGRV